jgi:murein DD-endopeptidase MepM/ murein hydrolase activator NlpD
MIINKFQFFLTRCIQTKSRKLAIFGGVFIIASLVTLRDDIGFSSIPVNLEPDLKTDATALVAPKISDNSEPKPARTAPVVNDVKLRRGDTLLRLLNRYGVDNDSAQKLAAAVRPYVNPKSLAAGQSIKLAINPANGEVRGLEFQRNGRVVRVSATAKGWEAEQEKIPSVKETRVVYGAVTDSLYESALEAGLTPNHIMELAALFRYNIDFFSDFRRGDEYSVLFDEKRYQDGRVEFGNILAAEIEAGGKVFRIFRFTGKGAKPEYYDGDGKARLRAFLRAPLSFTRISSRYNPHRRHPIFRTVRPHRAIDYAAPAGTPVVALGNGRITFAGWRGGYGNLVEVRHANGYVTRYAHFSKIAKRIRVGRQVSQGQVVGYVGQTGHATGPHLHFEMLRNGKKINFLALRIPAVGKLRGRELQRFKRERETMLAQLEGQSTLVANTSDCPARTQRAC